MRKTSIFSDLSAPTENKSTSSMCKHQLASLGSNQEGFEESNPHAVQDPICLKNNRIRQPHQLNQLSITSAHQSAAQSLSSTNPLITQLPLTSVAMSSANHLPFKLLHNHHCPSAHLPHHLFNFSAKLPHNHLLMLLSKDPITYVL